jgi:cardiolipin synthase
LSQTLENESQDAGLYTWPNLVTAIRIALIPVFVVLGVQHHNGAAAWLLAVIGATDWIDGKLARRLGQVSTVGKIIDPVADRMLVVAAVVVTLWVGAIPVWFGTLTLAREVFISLTVVALASLGAKRIDVLFIGKAGAMALMMAYPMFLLAYGPASWQKIVVVVAWVFGLLGLALSWAALGAYVRPAREALRSGRKTA